MEKGKDCPHCSVSDETINKLKEIKKDKKPQDETKKKKGLIAKLFKK